jgi:hypothetical protein
MFAGSSSLEHSRPGSDHTPVSIPAGIAIGAGMAGGHLSPMHCCTFAICRHDEPRRRSPQRTAARVPAACRRASDSHSGTVVSKPTPQSCRRVSSHASERGGGVRQTVRQSGRQVRSGGLTDIHVSALVPSTLPTIHRHAPWRRMATRSGKQQPAACLYSLLTQRTNCLRCVSRVCVYVSVSYAVDVPQ